MPRPSNLADQTKRTEVFRAVDRKAQRKVLIGHVEVLITG
jgi:hypothetical protein